MESKFETKSVQIILTGGTIDMYPTPDGTKGDYHEHSTLPKYLEILKLYDSVECTELFMMDSRKMTEEHRKKILDAVENSSHKHIIVTHGTFTMCDTAEYLKENLKRNDQTIVHVAAFKPIDNGPESDGLFNLGFAFAEAKTLPPGVYIGMHGRVFEAGTVRKDVEKGRFVLK